jgi:environmental stress-induced protein Ves
MQIIEPTAWHAQPWRNGAGVTHELLRWPDADPFALRVSVADIAAPAPFSAFAGYRRWLYLLEGGPVTLALAGRDAVLAAPGDGIAFDGAAAVAASVVARPSRDLNFMVRAELPARAELLRGGARAGFAGAAAVVFAITGGVEVSDGARYRALGRHACAWGTDAHVEVALAAGALAAALVVER